MGKDLKGKELGKGISQRPDGKYTARIMDGNGHRVQKYFPKLQEARKWYAEQTCQKLNGGINVGSEMAVDAWFEYWMENYVKTNARLSTIYSYECRYKKHIKESIGKMPINKVKSINCQNILTEMSNVYKNSTINLVRTTMKRMFDCAVDNDLISKNPVSSKVKCTAGKKSETKDALTIEEQKMFLEYATFEKKYNQVAFVLQTGLRVGELIGLKWEDIDMKGRVLHVRRTMIRDTDGWHEGEPKSVAGIREIPLTEEAVLILKNQRKKVNGMDITPIQYRDFVFIEKKGLVRREIYDKVVARICRKANIRKISMHTLRHTFATRCAEGGMKPKTLQTIMGHSNISITMNTYVHVTDNEKKKELEAVEQTLKVV